MSKRLLTARQCECLALVRQGLTSVEIAVRLGISRRTVDQYVAESGRRLGAHRRAQIVAEAGARGEI